MNINPTNNAVSVHGREALNLPYSRWTEGSAPSQVDISTSVIFVEIPAARLRKRLISDPADPMGLLIHLSRTDVEKLPTSPSPYVLIDETDEDNPKIQLEGQIFRTGYKGFPLV
jgi:hypothetical protein